MTQIALKLYTMNPDQLLTFAEDVFTRMTANATIFTTPTLALVDFQSSIDDLKAAQAATLLGGKAATATRNSKRRTLEENLTVLANYVWNISRGNEDIILLAGMPMKRRGPMRYDFLNTPTDLRTESIYGEAVILRWKKVSNAKSYEVEYCKDPMTEDNWVKSPIISASRTVVNGLLRKEEYWFRVRAFGSQGMVSEWSNPTKQLVS
jgi:hypothetical protein